jgi:ribosomal protein S18 acetylase RimI-like enzyme
MNYDFNSLQSDAVQLLSAATGVDYSETEFSNPNLWLCCTVRDGHKIALIVCFEFKSWCDAHVTTVMIDKRALNRRLLTAMIRSVFQRAARITALIDPDNNAALNQVWRMGFKYEGYIRRGIEGKRDAVMFGLLPEDCPYMAGAPFRFKQAMIHPQQPGVH